MTGMGRPSTNSCSRRTIAGICLFLAALTWLVFGQTLRHPFVNYDDQVYVYENRSVLAGLTFRGMAWAFTHTVNANWHPLTVMSHMLDCTLYGVQAGGHHFTNVLLHSTAVVLLFLVLRDLTGATWRSAFVAALFAIHPLHVESVAWVSERKDVLSALFFVLTIAAYVRFARLPSFARYLVVAVLFALGLMCKPMLVTLPVILLLLDYWPLRRFGQFGETKLEREQERPGPGLPGLILEKLPLLCLSVFSSVATVLAQEKTIAAMSRLPMSSRAANAVVTIMTYARQMIWPSDLAVLYPIQKQGLPWWQILFSIAFVAAITIGVWRWKRTRPYLVTGWLWYLIMLGPILGIVQVGLQSHADRYTYLPHIGLYMLITWTVADLGKGWRYGRATLTVGATCALAVLAWSASIQTSYWSDTIKLWTHAVAVTANNDIAHGALSAAFLKAGQLDEAIEHSKVETSIRPVSAEGHNRLGVAFFRKGQLDVALIQFERVLRINPKYPGIHYNIATVQLEKGRLDEAISEYGKELGTEADYTQVGNNFGRTVAGDEELDEALLHNNLGAALARKGELDEALPHFQKALALSPSHPKVHYNLGNALLQTGATDGAIAQFEEELKIQPNYALASSDLGIALSQKGRMREAIEQWQRALEIEPENLNAQCNLAWVLATNSEASQRNGAKSVALAQRAVESSGGKNPRILRLLAAAWAEQGDFPKAIATAELALQLSHEQGNLPLARTLQTNIDLFKAGSPLRDTTPSAQSR